MERKLCEITCVLLLLNLHIKKISIPPIVSKFEMKTTLICTIWPIIVQFLRNTHIKPARFRLLVFRQVSSQARYE